MFGLLFLFIIAVFFLLLIVSSKLFPKGFARYIYIASVLGVVAFYPYAYKFTAAFSDFNELCEQTDRYQVLKSKPVSFILIEWGFHSDCTNGPNFIDGFNYAGFDCKSSDRGEDVIYRFTKTPTWHSGCGLECFDRSLLVKPESNYKTEYRYGYMDGKDAILTDGYGITVGNLSRVDKKLEFNDRLLVDNEIMSFGRDYTYYPYGNGLAKILGAASGSAPTLHCTKQFIPMDLRDVYKQLTR